MRAIEFLDIFAQPSVPFSLVYEDDPPVDGEDPPVDGEDPPAELPADRKKKEVPKVQLDDATQKYVNSLLAEEKRKGQAKNAELIKQLETQKNKAGTSEAEQTRLQTRIDELQSEYQTQAELGKKAHEKKVKTLTEERDNAKKEADSWKALFHNSTVTNSLLGAATAGKAYNPQQVVALLTPQTRLVEVTDEDGNVIPGQYQEKVKIRSKDKDGKTISLDLSASEAVKQMAELPEYANLFISAATGGLGSGSLGKSGNGGGDDEPPTDTAQYMAWRAERKKKGLPV